MSEGGTKRNLEAEEPQKKVRRLFPSSQPRTAIASAHIPERPPICAADLPWGCSRSASGRDGGRRPPPRPR
eukprot:COSAG04_NODE_3335_length_2916_cov_382.607739_1_plen_70_part_10